MIKYKNKYRIPSARLQTWDYANEGAYFITICTKSMTHFFGKIENKSMELSHIGVIADLLWHEIKNHTENVELGEFVVMPNHIHGVLILNDLIERDSTSEISEQKPIDLTKTIGQMRFQNQGKNTISAIVGSYKSAVTRHARRLGFEFAWQPSFHDHIIRDATSFETIKNYIVNNPANWGNDKFYKNE
jgi:putative transposase